jgi:peptidoglycan/xylan/chitin deacetylase (PgdA/CDA1 family)
MDKDLKREKRMVVMLLGIIILLIISAASFFFVKDDETIGVDTINKENAYDATKKIEKALKKIKSDSRQAAVITDIQTTEKKVALTFDGLADAETMGKILELLDIYNMRGTFFVSGIGAAEDPKTVQSIVKAKQEVGSYSLEGKKHMEKLTLEELVEDYCRTNVILDTLTGKEPKLLKCNVTEYTEEVLRAAHVSHITGAVRSTQFLNYKSFSSYEMTKGYVKRLPEGSIISIKTEGYLDEEEYTEKVQEKPAVDKQAGIEVTESQQVMKGEEQLIQVVEWLLQALQETEYTTEFVKEFEGQPKREAATYLQGEKNENIQIEDVQRPTGYPKIHTKSNSLPVVPKPLPELSESDMKHKEFERLRRENKGELAKEIRLVYTTEQAVSYIFYGIGHETVFNDVLSQLYKINAKATFFVTMQEMQDYPDRILQIESGGHELGIAIVPHGTADYYTVCEEIDTARQYLKNTFNIDTDLVKQPWGQLQAHTKESISAMGCKLITHETAVVQTKDEYAVSAEEIMTSLFGPSMYALKRGQIVFFRMDYYKGSDILVGELIEKITQQKLSNIAYTGDYSKEQTKNGSEYVIKGVNALLSNKQKVYEYPLASESILTEVSLPIGTGHLAQMGTEDILQRISERYIGNPDVQSVTQLPGFTEEEIIKIDQKGIVKTEEGEKVIFLTFDDWGTDAAINHLLYVLRKHQVKATFFIRTNHVPSNPNLLRAIAEEGHDIASHTDSHRALADYDAQTKSYTSITEDERSQLQQDIILSYDVLKEIIGDVKNEEGRPTLTTMFRPPTLAVSRLGFETVLDSGYEYIVSGDFSTHDYEAKSKEELLGLLMNGILLKNSTVRQLENGSIAVMHMSDESQYTAEVIDEFLTKNQLKKEPERYDFAKLSDYLQKKTKKD